MRRAGYRMGVGETGDGMTVDGGGNPSTDKGRRAAKWAMAIGDDGPGEGTPMAFTGVSGIKPDPSSISPQDQK